MVVSGSRKLDHFNKFNNDLTPKVLEVAWHKAPMHGVILAYKFLQDGSGFFNMLMVYPQLFSCHIVCTQMFFCIAACFFKISNSAEYSQAKLLMK